MRNGDLKKRKTDANKTECGLTSCISTLVVLARSTKIPEVSPHPLPLLESCQLWKVELVHTTQCSNHICDCVTGGTWVCTERWCPSVTTPPRTHENSQWQSFLREEGDLWMKIKDKLQWNQEGAGGGGEKGVNSYPTLISSNIPFQNQKSPWFSLATLTPFNPHLSKWTMGRGAACISVTVTRDGKGDSSQGVG
jgi:hypothetical protein